MNRIAAGIFCLVFLVQTAVAGDHELTPLAEYAPQAHTSQSFMTAPDFEVFSPGLKGAADLVPSYTLPSHHYSGWYRPRAIGRDKAVRCGDDTFRPRGFGRLFARQINEQRLDYRPYQVGDWGTEYGPAYYRLAEDPRCEDCDHSAKRGCYGGHCGHHACMGHGVGLGMGSCGLGGGCGLLGGGLCGWFGADRCSACSDAGVACDACHARGCGRRRAFSHLITRRRARGVAADCACEPGAGCGTN